MEILNPHIKKNMLKYRRKRKKKKKQQFDERIEENATRETLHRSKIQVFPDKHKKKEQVAAQGLSARMWKPNERKPSKLTYKDAFTINDYPP